MKKIILLVATLLSISAFAEPMGSCNILANENRTYSWSKDLVAQKYDISEIFLKDLNTATYGLAIDKTIVAVFSNGFNTKKSQRLAVLSCHGLEA
jgi:hypothetical protein